MLGLGWSAGLVAGSALLTDSVPQPARAAVQGLSDLTRTRRRASAARPPGLIVAQASYGWLNAVGACLLLPMAALAAPRALKRPARLTDRAAGPTPRREVPRAGRPAAPKAGTEPRRLPRLAGSSAGTRRLVHGPMDARFALAPHAGFSPGGRI